MKTRKIGVCLLVLWLAASSGCLGTDSTKPAAVEPPELPFEMPPIFEPQIPDALFSIADFGAVGDGQTKNTESFARAIEACSKAGGGRVVVPAGLWLTGPIQLKSRLDLHLQRGAVILFSPDIRDYPLIPKSYEGRPEVRRMSPITGDNLEHIAITGPGIIDGSGHVWRPVKKEKLTERQWKKLIASGGAVESSGRIWWPSQQALEGPQTAADLRKRNASPEEYAAAGEFLRPVMVFLVNCSHVLLDGPTFENSPAWNIHPLLCENMIIRNITVRNPWYSQNGDGLDLESCRNVLLYDSCFDVGDDAMCIKSGRDAFGRQRGKPTENVAIWNCTVYHGHGGFTIGSEMSGGVRNILVQNCAFLGTDVGLRFKSTRGRGGVVENIYIRDIFMTDIANEAVGFNLFYSMSPPNPEQSLSAAAEPVSEKTPCFRKIYLSHIVCRGAQSAVYMQGLPEMPVQQIELKHLAMSAETGATLIETDQILMSDVVIHADKGPAFGLYNSRRITMREFAWTSKEGFLKVAGEKSRLIRLSGVDGKKPDQPIQYGPGASSEAVIWD